jgi:DNA-binding response OmpR family regulator
MEAADESSAIVPAMHSVLIVDDDAKLGVMLQEYLERHEIRLSIRHSGEAGLEAAACQHYDLMLLDVMLPDLDGFEVLQRLRVYSDISVLLLTARGLAADRIHGLQLGADDYLPKPFDPDELVARIRAILRRSAPRTLAPASKDADARLTSGNFAIDLVSRAARYKDALLDLTDIEFALLEAFLQAPGVVLSREELTVRVFERDFHPLNRTLDMHVCRLRKKLHSATTLNNLIKTIRSSGYLFSADDVQSSSRSRLQ